MSVKDTIRSVPPPDPAGLGTIDRPSTVTQTRPAATVSACGLPPKLIVAGLSVVGLMRVTVPSPLLATHTDPPCAATAPGASGTRLAICTGAAGVLNSGSIRLTETLLWTGSAFGSTTHTPSGVAASPVGDAGRGMFATVRRLLGSMRE